MVDILLFCLMLVACYLFLIWVCDVIDPDKVQNVSEGISRVADEWANPNKGD